MIFASLAKLLALAGLAQGVYYSFKVLKRTRSQSGGNEDGAGVGAAGGPVDVVAARAGSRLLQYWVVLSFLALHEQFTEPLLSWVPLYYPAKCALMVGFLLPHFKLSRYFFSTVVVPTVELARSKFATRVWPVVASRIARWTRVAYAAGLKCYVGDMQDKELVAWQDDIRQSLQAVNAELERRRAAEAKTE